MSEGAPHRLENNVRVPCAFPERKAVVGGRSTELGCKAREPSGLPALMWAKPLSVPRLHRLLRRAVKS